jgi:uncharacterized protein (TIGR02466 family)|tara:strand:+ start:3809 stop:4420 length:612 start_codon:yes stop_codon:yes gene_type:complete
MSEIQREFWFSIPFFYFDIENSKELNRELISDIYKWKEEDKDGVGRSNKQGWHSTITMHFREEFSKITNTINDAQKSLSIEEGYNSDWPLTVESMWANVSPKHAYNTFHTHPNALWSGVYYVQSPENCGRIKFLNVPDQHHKPIYDNEHREHLHQWSSVYYEPVEGRLILFPSNRGHEVEQNLSDTDRISISFNSIQMHKDRI